MNKSATILAASMAIAFAATASAATLLFEDTFSGMTHLSVGKLDSGYATWSIVASPGGKEGTSLKAAYADSVEPGWNHRVHDIGGVVPTLGIVTYKWSFMLNGASEETRMTLLSDSAAHAPQPLGIVGSRTSDKLGLWSNSDWAITYSSPQAWGPIERGQWHTIACVVDLDSVSTTDNVDVYLSQGLGVTTADYWTTCGLDKSMHPANAWQYYQYGNPATGLWETYIDDLAVYTGVALSEPPPPPPAKIGGHRQLFVDDAMVADTSNVHFTLHQPGKHKVNDVATPVLKADQPWEAGSVAVYGTTIYDEEDKLYKMWYRSIEGTCYICYATSPDGVNWDKPNLGVSPYDGSTDNNICHGFESFYTDGFGVVKDSDDPDPNRRYKMLTYKGGDRFAAMVSPDGINWSGPVNPQIHHTGDVISMYYDEGLGKYVGLTKRYINGKRSRLITFSEDLVNWTPPQVILTPDLEDAATAHIYSQVGYEYEGMRIGYIAVYDTATEKMDTQLVYSRDGKSWHRYRDRESFIPLGDEGDFDSGMVIAGSSGLIANDEEISIYYSGWNLDHDGNVIGGGEKIFGIGMAKLRKDGFVSAVAGPDGGTLTTVPFELPDTQLSINAATNTTGNVRAELLDADGEVIPGYGLADSSGFSGDSLGALLLWDGNGIDESLIGETVSLKFYLEDASLYSFWFTAALIPGDANDDGVVDEDDAAILASNWLNTGAGWAEGDFNADGRVDDADAALLAANWQVSLGHTADVPEPKSCVLLLSLLASIIIRMNHTKHRSFS